MSTQRSHIDYINYMIEKGDMKQFLRVLDKDQKDWLPTWLTPGAKFIIIPDNTPEMRRMSGIGGYREIDEDLKRIEINSKGTRTNMTLLETAMAHPQKDPADQSKVLQILKEWGASLSPPTYSPDSSASMSSGVSPASSTPHSSASSISMSPLGSPATATPSSSAGSVPISPGVSPASSLVLPSTPFKDEGAAPSKVQSLALLFSLSSIPADTLGKRLSPDWKGGLGSSGVKEPIRDIPARQARAFMGLNKLVKNSPPRSLPEDPSSS